MVIYSDASLTNIAVFGTSWFDELTFWANFKAFHLFEQCNKGFVVARHDLVVSGTEGFHNIARVASTDSHKDRTHYYLEDRANNNVNMMFPFKKRCNDGEQGD